MALPDDRSRLSLGVIGEKVKLQLLERDINTQILWRTRTPAPVAEAPQSPGFMEEELHL